MLRYLAEPRRPTSARPAKLNWDNPYKRYDLCGFYDIFFLAKVCFSGSQTSSSQKDINKDCVKTVRIIRGGKAVYCDSVTFLPNQQITKARNQQQKLRRNQNPSKHISETYPNQKSTRKMLTPTKQDVQQSMSNQTMRKLRNVNLKKSNVFKNMAENQPS